MPKRVTRRLLRRSSDPAASTDHRAILARRLDRLADHNLHLGFHTAAEQLARRAAEMREAAR